MSDTSRLLILNCVIDERGRDAFDRFAAPLIAGQGPHGPVEYEIAYLCTDDPLPSVADFSHVLISGSELSAARKNPRDAELNELIYDALGHDTPLLGICYGHQMLAVSLGGAKSCRVSPTPEFGWRRLRLGPDPLFEGIDDLISCHSHYDEVFHLTGDFRVIAETDRCEYQAITLPGRPVWGVQFHPEQDHVGGSKMLAATVKSDPRAKANFIDELEDPNQVKENLKIFANFLST